MVAMVSALSIERKIIKMYIYVYVRDLLRLQKNLTCRQFILYSRLFGRDEDYFGSWSGLWLKRSQVKLKQKRNQNQQNKFFFLWHPIPG